MGEQAQGESGYTAFLSYSHKDEAAAARLHRRLETYRLPKRLVGRAGARGPVPARLWPIFRDREELPAASDLSETVRDALARSGALIILCSPAAAASLWVAEEVETFRRLHPQRPMLAAILDGDPPDCFPAALRAVDGGGGWHEPLATDLRPHRDGRRLGLLKLVAGITGVGLDDLVQRDATRRIRRVTAITVAAVIAMLVTTALTVTALRARWEAERQRADAEGLIEFMLTDLRDKLAGAGSLDAMQAVNARALLYYGSGEDLAGLTDESLARRARILQAIGDDDLALENLPAALAAFEQARQSTAEQLARAPDDPERIFEHAKSELGIGRVYESRRDWPVAQSHYVAANQTAERLLAIDPRNPDYLGRIAGIALDLGNIQLNGSRNTLAAQQSYQRGVSLLERAARERPDDLHIRLSQANAYGWLADSFYMNCRWADALANRSLQFGIVTALHSAQPRNADVAFRLAAAERGFAYALLRSPGDGNGVRARALFLQAFQESEALIRIDPHNADWRTLHDLLGRDHAVAFAQRTSTAGWRSTTRQSCQGRS